MSRTSLLCLALIVCGCTKPAVSTPVDAGTPSNVAALDGDAGLAVRFVALGDTGKGNAGQKQVGVSVGAVCAAHGCDFVVLLGDNFYPTGVESATDPQWKTKFTEPYATVDPEAIANA